MISTPEGFTNNSIIFLMKSTPIKKPSAQKSLCLFTNIFEVKKNAYRRVGAATYKRKAVKFGNKPWEFKQNRKGSSIINEQIRSLFITGLCIIHKL